MTTLTVSGSRVALIADKLVDVFEAVKANDLEPKGISVLDGPRKRVTQGDVLVVGYSAEGSEAFIVDMVPRPGLRNTYVEVIHVICNAYSWRGGSPDFKTRRARVVAMLDAISDQLANSDQLDGTCDRVLLDGDQSWVQDDSDGASVSVGFAIRVETNRS